MTAPMTIWDTIGFGWVVLATGLFTAQVLISAVYSLILGIRTIWRQYKRGAADEALDIRDADRMRQDQIPGVRP